MNRRNTICYCLARTAYRTITNYLSLNVHKCLNHLYFEKVKGNEIKIRTLISFSLDNQKKVKKNNLKD